MLFENLDVKKEYVFIVFKELKQYLLIKKASNPQLNIKIYSLEDLEKGVFGETTIESIKESLPFCGDDFSIAKKFISYIKKGVDVNLDERINKIKENLIKKDLLFIDQNFSQVFKNKEIYILGYSKENIELNHCLQLLNINNPKYFSLENLFPQSDFDVYKFARNDEEIRYAFIKILDLLKSGVKPDEIRILTDTTNNYFYLKLFEKEFGLILDIDQNQTLYDTKIAKILEKEIENLTIDNFDSFDDQSENFKDIKDILTYFDFFNLKNKLNNFKNILKEYKIHDSLTTESIKVTSNIDYTLNKHIFVLGFDSNLYGKSSKNNDYFDDNLKEKFNLNASAIKNIEYDTLYEYFLRTNNIFYLYYHESDGNKRDISFYLHKRYPKKEEQKIHIKNPEVLKREYSEVVAKLYYSYYFDLNYKFYLRTKYFDLYKNYFGTLPRYNPDFSGANVKARTYKNYSYSEIDKYYGCPFKYFCDRILKLDEYESNYFADAGNLIHKVLESTYDETKEFDEVFEIISKEYEDKFSEIQKQLVLKIKKVAKYVFYKLREDYKKNNLKKAYAERQIVIQDNLHDYKINGRIDSILEVEAKSIRAVQIIDYKTGSTKNINDTCLYGINLQLPVYMYLLKNSEDFKDVTISGTYYIHLFDKDRYNNFFENDFEASKEAYLKDGITLGDVDIFKMFENDIQETRTSSQVSKIKLKANGDFSRHKDVNFIDPIVEIDDDGNEHQYPCLVRQAFDVFNSLIDENYYEISPFKPSASDEGACRYCEYKDICFNNHKLDRIKKAIVKFKGCEYKDEE